MKFIAVALVIAIGLVLVISFSTTKKVVAVTTIAAEPAAVWRVIVGLDSYSEWHPILLPLEGRIEAGQRIRYRWTPASGKPVEVKSAVKEVRESEHLHQRGSTPGLLTFDHRFELEEVSPGETRVTQSELYRGIGLWFWDAQQMQGEYAKANEALKERVEAAGDPS